MNIFYVIVLCAVSYIIGNFLGFTEAMNKCTKKLEEML